MFCTKCGVQLREDDRFCSQCGSRTGLGRIVNSPRALMLDRRNRKFAGVCAGFARYLEVDVILIRVLWLAVAITTGVGFLVLTWSNASVATRRSTSRIHPPSTRRAPTDTPITRLWVRREIVCYPELHAFDVVMILRLPFSGRHEHVLSS